LSVSSVKIAGTRMVPAGRVGKQAGRGQLYNETI
jgi:hypothetical protein